MGGARDEQRSEVVILGRRRNRRHLQSRRTREFARRRSDRGALAGENPICVAGRLGVVELGEGERVPRVDVAVDKDHVAADKVLGAVDLVFAREQAGGRGGAGSKRERKEQVREEEEEKKIRQIKSESR